MVCVIDANTEESDPIAPLRNGLVKYYAGFASTIIVNNYTSFNEGAFSNLSHLVNVTINSDITTIVSEMFKDCEKLERVAIYASNTADLKEINIYEQGCFENCKSLVSIVTSYGIANARPSYMKNMMRNYIRNSKRNVSKTAFKFPDRIESRAFYGCTKLKNFTLPTNLTTIDKEAFEKCSSLQSIVFPNSLDKIDEFAFDGTAITSIDIPTIILSKNISSNAFVNTQLKTIYIRPNDVINSDSESGYDKEYYSIFGNNKQIYGVKNVNVNMYFTQDLYEKTIYTLTTYLQNAFNKYNQYLEANPSNKKPSISVKIEKGITEIGENAFKLPEPCFFDLNTIYLPETITNIGNNAFYYTGAKIVGNLINVTSIGEYAFEGSILTNKTKLSIHGGVTIGKNAFRGQSKLKITTHNPNGMVAKGASDLIAFNKNNKNNNDGKEISVGINEMFFGASNTIVYHHVDFKPETMPTINNSHTHIISTNAMLIGKLQTYLNNINIVTIQNGQAKAKETETQVVGFTLDVVSTLQNAVATTLPISNSIQYKEIMIDVEMKEMYCGVVDKENQIYFIEIIDDNVVELYNVSKGNGWQNRITR